MSWQDVQRRLNGLGYGLSVDGDPGPLTLGALFAYMGAKDTAPRFGHAASAYFTPNGLTTPLRVAHFMAQAAFETAAFRYLTEIWGPTAEQLGYEGRADLGNTQPGDGYRYRGRGIFQLTGRDNYQRYSQRLDMDLLATPDLAAAPPIALEIACLYWSDLALNTYADRDDAKAVSNGINRGNPNSTRMPNGYAGRIVQLERAKAVLS